MSDRENPGSGWPRITFLPTVTLGGVIHLLVIVAAIVGAFLELRAQVETVTTSMASIERRLDGMVGRAEFDRAISGLDDRTKALGYRVDRLVDGHPPGHQ